MSMMQKHQKNPVARWILVAVESPYGTHRSWRTGEAGPAEPPAQGAARAVRQPCSSNPMSDPQLRKTELTLEEGMSDLLETTIEAHGGLERWNQLDAVSVRDANGGALWALKGQAGVLDDVFVRANLHQERESHHPFGAPDRRSAFTPERVAIESTSGEVV